jgi:hypothetical protein
MQKQADALKVPDACLLVMAQRPSRSLGLPETRSLIFLIKNSPDKKAEGYLDYLHPPPYLCSLPVLCRIAPCTHNRLKATLADGTVEVEATLCVSLVLPSHSNTGSFASWNFPSSSSSLIASRERLVAQVPVD